VEWVAVMIVGSEIGVVGDDGGLHSFFAIALALHAHIPAVRMIDKNCELKIFKFLKLIL